MALTFCYDEVLGILKAMEGHSKRDAGNTWKVTYEKTRKSILRFGQEYERI